MNLYLLEAIGKWINFTVISILALFGFLESHEVNLVSKNDNINKSFSLNYDIQPYETEIIYKSNMPQGKELVVSPGQEGVEVFYEEEKVLLQEQKTKVKHVGTGPSGVYYGNLTGYGADCRGCDGRGNLACFQAGHNLVEDGVYYEDDEYGKVRVVAAPSPALSNGQSFSCGTIVKISFDDYEKLTIVLDRGIALENRFAEGTILFDLAFVSERDELSDIRSITRQDGSVQFEVKRWGF